MSGKSQGILKLMISGNPDSLKLVDYLSVQVD